jgi:16S rRNA (guanine527-N7)-methyltransferase
VSLPRLKAGVHALGLDLDDQRLERLLAYLDLLAKWNRAYNLTAIREREHMISRHLFDSLAVLPHLHPGSLLDVGSGAGLPGIPLALADPRRAITVLDSNGKKTRFLEHVKLELGLEQVTVVRARVEEYVPLKPYAMVISRAFASLDAMITTCRHLVAEDGELLAMKGQYPQDEVTALGDTGYALSVQELNVPDLAEARCLLRLVPARGPEARQVRDGDDGRGPD